MRNNLKLSINLHRINAVQMRNRIKPIHLFHGPLPPQGEERSLFFCGNTKYLNLKNLRVVSVYCNVIEYLQ